VREQRTDTKRQLAKTVMGAMLPRRMFVTRGAPRDRLVYLTFDDGPDPVHTPRLLDVLREHDVPATFFLIGERAAEHLSVVKRMAGEGHAVGHHSYHHARPEGVSATTLEEEVMRTRAVLADVLGYRPTLFRPPYGRVTAAKLACLWRTRQCVVLWNVDSHDFSCTSAEEVRDLFRRQPLESGDIVLMHDNHPYAGDFLPELIEATRARGLRFGSLASMGRWPWTR
jgi:peptidoglycan/xylan/chitin deacetylase (PgdA/CDA1 family)